MTRVVPNIFGPLINPSLPNLDNDFAAVTPAVVLPCIATGSNAITLTPVAGTLNATAYTDKDRYSFVAVANSTGAMTVQVAALGALNLYRSGGSIQANTGDVVSGQYYDIAYQASLNAAAGGFVIVSAVASAATTAVLHQQVFLSTGTFTTPASTGVTTVFKFTLTGGGGGGGANAGISGVGGGGAGATAIMWVSGLTAATAVAITVGSGGAGTGATASGSSGINSSVVVNALTVLAAAGNGGVTVNVSGSLWGGNGGIATGGLINIRGGDGAGGSDSPANGGPSYWGGGGNGLDSGAGAARPGGAPGAGGGASISGAGGTSGPGADGICIVEWTA